MDILENQSFWFSFEPGNTGKQANLITSDPGNTGTQASLITSDPGNTGTQAILITLILYISLNTDFGIFLQKRRAPKWD